MGFGLCYWLVELVVVVVFVWFGVFLGFGVLFGELGC